MAKLVEENITITISKILKNRDASGDTEEFFTNAVLDQLESIIPELVNDPSIIVEVTRK